MKFRTPIKINDDEAPPPWLLRSTFLVIGAVLVTYFSLRLLTRLSDFVFWIVTALFLSFALEPLVNKLEKKGLSRGLATGLIIGVGILVMLIFIGAMVPLIVTQVKELINTAPVWIYRASDFLWNNFKIKITTDELLQQIQNANISIGSTASNVAGNIVNLSNKILGIIFQIATVLLFTFYFVAEGPTMRRRLLSIIPTRHQKIILETWEVAIDKTGGYLYSRILLALASTFTTFVILTILDIPFAVPLAMWMGLISQFIPVVGTFIAASLPLLVTLLERPFAGLIFIAFILIYQQLENYILSPRITARTMQLHPAVAIGAAITGANLAGALGAFLALPLAAIVQATVSTYIKKHDLIEDSSELLGVKKKSKTNL